MADKLTLPKAKFAVDLTAGPVDPTMKAAEATTAKLYRVPIGKIKTIPGFNLRVETPDYIEHRDGIKASIAANGYNAKKPLAGYVASEDGNNVIYVTDGHTRLAAAEAYNEENEGGDVITHLPVLVAPKETTLSDLLVELHTANTGRKLTPFEQGILGKRLIGEGMTKNQIAEKLGFTPRYLDDVLLLANAEPKVRQHVASGAVSSTLAINTLRKDGDDAAEKIEAIVAKAAKVGKKATAKLAQPKTKAVKVEFNYKVGQDMKEIVKAAASAIREAIPAEEGEDDLKTSTVAGFVTIVVKVPAEEKTEEPKKAEAKAKKPAKKGKTKVVKTEEPKKAKKAKAPPPVEGAEEIEDEDSEQAKLPPKVKSDDNVPDEEVDI